MAHQTEQEEKTISALMSLLQERHNQEPVDRYCHYVVFGEDEEEDGSCESFCQDCIDMAVRKSKGRWMQKRGLEMGRVRQLRSNGYYIFKGYNEEYKCMTIMLANGPTESIKSHCAFIESKYKEEAPLFSYRYYQRDSDTTTRNCDNCGKFFEICVTADTQEIEHWENDIENADFLIADMDSCIAYQLYEVLQFMHQAKDDVYKKGVALAEKILRINQGESPSTCDATDSK